MVAQRVGVSRSASIVVRLLSHPLPHSELTDAAKMAYMMRHLHMGLMDAYLMTRARRLNGPFSVYLSSSFISLTLLRQS